MTSVPPQSLDENPTVVFEPPGAEAKGPNVKRAVAVGVVAAVLIAGAGAGAWAMAGDVPRGTRVLGVDLGATSRTEAERKLTETFGPRAGEPVRVDLDGKALEIKPESIAMTLDVDATVGRAMKGGTRVFGGRTVDPVIRLDQAKL